MHYGLRLIERCQWEFWNFVSHFIHIQIFRMEILALSLVLCSSKYSRYICGDKVNMSTFIVILVKFSAPKSSNFFLWKIWDIRNSKRAAKMRITFRSSDAWSTFLSLLHFKKRKQKIQAGLPIHYEKEPVQWSE